MTPRGRHPAPAPPRGGVTIQARPCYVRHVFHGGTTERNVHRTVLLVLGMALLSGLTGCASQQDSPAQTAEQKAMLRHNTYGFDDYGDHTSSPPGLGGPH
jgi:hypothetical protein